jgi:hypothetical protein
VGRHDLEVEIPQSRGQSQRAFAGFDGTHRFTRHPEMLG